MAGYRWTDSPTDCLHRKELNGNIGQVDGWISVVYLLFYRSSQENWFQIIEMEGSWPSPKNLLNLLL